MILHNKKIFNIILLDKLITHSKFMWHLLGNIDGVTTEINRIDL